MIDPKAYYRKLDQLLAKISLQSDDASFLPDILVAFEEAFGPELRFGNGRLYEEQDSLFVRIAGGPNGSPRLRLGGGKVKPVLDHGSYIFDQDPYELGAGYVTPAAFAVSRTSARRWIFAFDLADGWQRDEITFAMNAVRFALNHRLQAEHVKGDLQQAAEIQKSLLPADPPPFAGYAIAARSVPAESVGGDFFDFIEMEDGPLGVSIGDASGHGLPAALLVRDVMIGMRMGLEARFKMLSTLKKLNRVVHRSNWSSRFVSVFYGELEANGNLLYANAGHIGPMIVRATETVNLEPTGMIMGPLPEAPLDRAYARVEKGDSLVLLTDGLMERFNDKNEMFGAERIADIVREQSDKPVQEVLEAIYASSSEFGGNRVFDDDASIVILRRDA